MRHDNAIHAEAPSRILALDTASGEIAACVIHNGNCHASSQHEDNGGKTRSTRIVPMLAALLEQAGLRWQQLDALALGAGPGSFTGVRIAAATLAGVNAGLHLPIIHLSSLAITARQADSTAPVRVLEDARAGEVFCGYYRHGNMLEADSCLNWAQIETLTPGLYCCHNEPATELAHWQRQALTLPRSKALALETQAVCAQVVCIQTGDWRAMPVYPEPVYLQLSQAERNVHEAR